MTQPTPTLIEAPRPPKAPGMPILGNAHHFMGDPMPFFLDMYERLGPIFRIQMLNQKFVVMGGLEANRFLAQEGETHFTSETLFGKFGVELGSAEFLVAIDGEPHRHWRKVMQRGYSKGGVAPHLDSFAELTYRAARQWRSGETINVRDAMQRLVTKQLGLALTHHDPAPHFEAIQRYFNTLLSVYVIKRWPRLMLLDPRYRRARAEAMALARQVLAEHRNGDDRSHPDLIDDLLKAKDINGRPMSEGDLLAATVGPYFAGMDTVANTLGFMLYAVHKHPDVLRRIRAEVDEHFADGVPPWRKLPKLQALYGATLETLRRYPVTPFTPRGVVKPFSFAGRRVEAGEEVLILNGLTHFLPEFFPDPFKFDVDRYTAPRKEHRQGVGIFAPYTLGAHACLGAGIAEVQLMVTAGALVRAVSLELSAPDYEIKTKMMPIPGPDPRFKLRVVGHRLGSS